MGAKKWYKTAWKSKEMIINHIHHSRFIGLPTTVDGCDPTLTATYDYGSVANMLNTRHYPRLGVGVVFET